MPKLIEALNIFLKYGDNNYPTQCEHDELYVMTDVSLVSEADLVRLKQLGFVPYDGIFRCTRYGSA